MKLLFFSDLQAEFSNLGHCETAVREIRRTARKKFMPDAVIFAGDGKEQYNPIDLRVVQFWQRAVRDLREDGLRVIMMKGNHDRLSQSRKSRDWLDIMRPAGAEIVTRPKVKLIGDGLVAFMPFTADKKQEAEWLLELSIAAAEQKALHPKGSFGCILVFHTGIAGVQMGSISSDGIAPDALLCDGVFDAAFGGHFHEEQQLEGYPIWYIGSPFCHDWGEANQLKGHVTVEFRGTRLRRVAQEVTKLPHWYDSEWLEKRRSNCETCGASGVWNDGAGGKNQSCPACTPEPGALVRSKVAVTTKQISAQLTAEEDRIAGMFADVRPFVIPKLIAQESDITLTGASDQEQIEQYVAATLPEAAKFTARQAVGYLARNLSGIAQKVSNRPVRFVSLEGENVLSYPKIKIDYRNQGLVLLRGSNRDLKDATGRKKSNGAGKTSALSLLPIAMFGETLKKQKHDSWAREHTKRAARLKLVMRDGKRRIEIERGRRPHKIGMLINGEDVSTGIRGTGRNETQGQIERETGFTLDMLMNSVYIDQTVVNGFLFGTQKSKMDLIGKLQDLTRFDAATRAVKKDISEKQEAFDALVKELQNLRDELDRLRADKKEIRVEIADVSVWHKERRKATEIVAELLKAYQVLKGQTEFYEKLRMELDHRQHYLDSCREKHDGGEREFEKFDNEYQRAKALVDAGKCSKCGQSVEARQYSLKKRKGKLEGLEITLASFKKEITICEEGVYNLDRKIDDFDRYLEEGERELAQARERLAYTKTGADREASLREKALAKRKRIRARIAEVRRALETGEWLYAKKERGLEMRYYAIKALGRTGMPLYLCSTLCSYLNRSAEEYAELFWDGKIKTMFEIVDGELVATVINPSGSRKIKGQSTGEAAMAGWVTAFAVREASPKTNLLIIDEPGAGLDSEGQKQLAKGLVKLKESGRFDTIIVTTHSPVIEGVLEGEATVWRVIKHKRRSRLLTQ